MRKLMYEEGKFNWLYFLFILNVLFFLILFIGQIFSGEGFSDIFAIHSGDKFSLIKPWKLLLHSFCASNVFMLISNLIWLWIFGDIIASMLGTRRVFSLYLFAALVTGTIAGILCYFKIDEKFPIYLLGADMPIIAIAAAAVYKFPTYRIQFFIISIPLWIIGVVFVLLRLFTNPHAMAALMLLIGFVALGLGVWFMHQLNSGNDITSFIYSFSDKIKNIFSAKPKAKLVVMNNKNTTAKQKNEAEEKTEKLNAILDKISANGIDSLSKAEKSFLEQYSK